MADTKDVFVPKQTTRRGVAGYRGANVVVMKADGTEDKAATAAAHKAAKAKK